MDIRSMVIGRILYALSTDELYDIYHVDEAGLEEMSDLDLFELYEDLDRKSTRLNSSHT